jgi:hypothetical protein
MHLFVILEQDSRQRSASCPGLLFPLYQNGLAASQSVLRRLGENKILWTRRDLNHYHPVRHIITKLTELSRLYLV